MNINLIAVGKNMPQWVEVGFQEYAKRLPADYNLSLIEIPLIKRSKTTNIEQIKTREGEQLLNAIPKGSHIIALDEHGKLWDTTKLAERLQYWRENYREVSFLIGGPDGLAQTCLDKANAIWSLSPLTLPHLLVRVIIAEQLYRAWSILTKHPYHRV